MGVNCIVRKYPDTFFYMNCIYFYLVVISRETFESTVWCTVYRPSVYHGARDVIASK